MQPVDSQSIQKAVEGLAAISDIVTSDSMVPYAYHSRVPLIQPLVVHPCMLPLFVFTFTHRSSIMNTIAKKVQPLTK